jgi:protein-tyrosine phosphatase
MYNFGPAAPSESIVFGACRPSHDRRAPVDDSIDDWIEYMEQQGIERVCCLLDDQQLSEYDNLLKAYTEYFGAEKMCHAPITDFRVIDKPVLRETVLPFLKEAVARSEPTVVHCSAGQGRTGHVLVLWLVHGRGYELEDAIQAVRRMGRSPLEAASRNDLKALIQR